MRSNRLVLAVLFLAVAGCSDSSTETALSELRTANSTLTKQVESANKRIEEAEAKVASLEAAWKQFSQGYDPEKRAQLTKNTEVAEQLIARVTKDGESSAAVLSGFQKIETEIVKLRDLCKKHEAESRDANEIGKVKGSLDNVMKSVATLESSIRDKATAQEHSVRSLKSDVSSLSSRVRSLASDLSSVKMKVR